MPWEKGEYFFLQAEFFGSSDNREWEYLASLMVSTPPKGGEWRNFDFDNLHPHRCYRLVINPEYGAGERGPITLSGSWMFDAVDRKIKAEDLF